MVILRTSCSKKEVQLLPSREVGQGAEKEREEGGVGGREAKDEGRERD